MENIDLNKMPILKSLLRKYVAEQYEELSNEMTEHDLIAEYQYLKISNKLHLLFEPELLRK